MVRARLSNLSDRAGDEVPQLYVRPRVASAVAGQRLVAYQRVHLAAGESRIIEFAVPASRLSVLAPDNRPVLEPGIHEVTLGTSSRDGLEGTVEVVAARTATRNSATP